MTTKISLLLVTPVSATFEVANGHAFLSPEPHCALVNGEPAHEGSRNVFTLRGLRPDTDYRMEVANARRGDSAATPFAFRTPPRSILVDVRSCGARGDGVTDDTAALQAAIASCSPGGTVVLPEGTWLSGPLFLRSHVDVCLARGARLLGHPGVDRWPVLPGVVDDGAGGSPVFIGSWEGQPADCHAALLTGIGVSNVRIHGEGCIDANSSFDTWWSRPNARFLAWRPRTIFLAHSEAIGISGVTLCNSPSWTVHPLYCRDVRCVDLRIEQPPEAPNTDGINPESCEDVLIAGVQFSTGDDCIALKSGKAWVAGRNGRATRRVTIANCRMERGHGAIVIGSEMAAGVYDVLARDCLFEGTDRGLRIKTRRDRGAQAVVDGVRMQNVRMVGVGTPVVVNSFYCPPGRPEELSADVEDRDAHGPRERVPALRNVRIADVSCERVAHSAGYVLGLPERPLENLAISNYRVRYDPQAEAGYPDMGPSFAPALHEGLYLCNVRGLALEGIDIEGADGPTIRRENVA
jgi:polygalacturonase